jgi:hypothetical protein
MSVLFSSHGVSRVYYGTDTRAQALLIGAALAVVYVAKGTPRGVVTNRAITAAALLGAGVIAWLWGTAGDDSTWLYGGGFLLAALAVAAVVVGVIRPRSGALGAVCSLPALRWIGRISYGLYLWHWPIYVVLTTDRIGLDGTPLLLARLAATFAVATASYYLVELPVRNGALRGWRAMAVVPTAAGALIAGLLLVTSGATPVIAAGDTDRAALGDVRAANAAAMRTLDDGRAGAPDGAAASGADAISVPDEPLRVLVVGDSVALTLGLGLQEVGMQHNIVTVNKSKMGCGITHGGDVLVAGQVERIRDDCGDWGLRWAAARDEVDPDIAVVLLGAWDAYDRRIDGSTWIPFGTPESDALLSQDLQGAVDVLAREGTEVAFATVPYFESRFVVNRPDEFRSSFDPWRVDHLNALVRSVVASNRSRAVIIDLNRYLSPDGQFQAMVEGNVLQDDGVHFGVDGRKVVAGWFAPRLELLARSVH